MAASRTYAPRLSTSLAIAMDSAACEVEVAEESARRYAETALGEGLLALREFMQDYSGNDERSQEP